MTDVVDVEFRKTKERLLGKSAGVTKQMTGAQSSNEITSISAAGPSASTLPQSVSTASAVSGTASSHLDFSTLRNIHTTYLERLLTGSLLSNPALTSTLRTILEVCERFVGQVERWGGDILPALLFEGSLAAGGDRVGELVEERKQIVAEINEVRLQPTFSWAVTHTCVDSALVAGNVLRAAVGVYYSAAVFCNRCIQVHGPQYEHGKYIYVPHDHAFEARQET